MGIFFPDPKPYQTGNGGAVAAGGTTVKKLEKITTLSPTITGGGSSGATVNYAGTAFSVTVPKGATKLQVLPGPVEPTPGVGAAADVLAHLGITSSPSDIGSGLVPGDTVTITPYWVTDNIAAVTVGKLRCSLMLMWL